MVSQSINETDHSTAVLMIHESIHEKRKSHLEYATQNKYVFQPGERWETIPTEYNNKPDCAHSYSEVSPQVALDCVAVDQIRPRRLGFDQLECFLDTVLLQRQAKRRHFVNVSTFNVTSIRHMHPI